MSGINVNVVDLGNVDFDLDDDEDFSTDSFGTEFQATAPEATEVTQPVLGDSLRETLKGVAQSTTKTKKKMVDDIPPRFVILDMNHLIHRYEYGMQTALSAEVEVVPAIVGYRVREESTGNVEDMEEKDFEARFGFEAVLGVYTNKEEPIKGADGFYAQKIIYQPAQKKTLITKIPYGILRSIARWSRYGKDRIIVCSDLGGLASRKSLFLEMYPELGNESSKKGGYKSNRNGLPHHLKEPLMCMTRVLNEAGIHQVRKPDYEADDFIKAIIDKLKEEEPGTAIDVITNDADLLPLVDETVSVFLSTKNVTFPESGPLSKRKYKMVTPENYQETCEGLSVYKNSKIVVPYNSLLLVKMLRGDKSDEIPQVPKITPTRVREIIDSLEANFQASGYPELMEETFRYGVDPYNLYKVLAPVMLSAGVFPVFKLLLEQELRAEYARRVDAGTINPEETPISTLRPQDLDIDLPLIYDELWDLKPELKDMFEEAVGGQGTDGMGGITQLSLAIKNFILMDLNNSLNGKREPLTMKAVPKPYNYTKLARASKRIFNINLDK